MLRRVRILSAASAPLPRMRSPARLGRCRDLWPLDADTQLRKPGGIAGGGTKLSISAPEPLRNEVALDLRPVLMILGMLTVGIGTAMLIPAAVDLLYHDTRAEFEFVISSCASLGVGGLLVMANRGVPVELTLRQVYLLTFGAWTLIPAVGALPLAFSRLGISYTDAFFETMSGITTTGSTVLVGLDDMPSSILLWRALMQWLGGIGIVVMAIAIFPFIKTGGMQLFHAESSDRSDKPLPRIRSLALSLSATYTLLTFACGVGYFIAGMSAFDALTHAMTTLSTAGYSTHDASFGHFTEPAIAWVGIVFMLLAATPFLLFLRAALGDWSLLRDRQVRVMLLIVVATCLVLSLWLEVTSGRPALDSLTTVTFNVVSVMTTTGYASEDYAAWGPFATAIFLYLMFIGGCTGSTCGAIKIFRFRVMVVVLAEHLHRRFQPHVVSNRRYDGKPLTLDVVEGVMAFLALYFAAVAVIAIALTLLGLDWMTSFSSSVQALGNVGPGLGPIVGPAGNFSSLPDAAKWLLAFGMLLGRLELVTVLVMFAPRFWRA